MKYLKISLILFVCSLIFNSFFVYAADLTLPVSGSVTVTSVTWKKSPNRSKINNNYQKVKITSATCSGCSFTAKPYKSDGTPYTATTGIAVGSKKSLTSNALGTGTWYIELTRSDFSLINQTASYTYDANALVL